MGRKSLKNWFEMIQKHFQAMFNKFDQSGDGLLQRKEFNFVLKEFTHDWQSCQILVAHNLEFDNKLLQAEYHRNSPICG